MLTALVILVGVGLLLFVLKKTAFSRVSEAGGAQVNKASRWLWSKDPVAVFQNRIDNASDNMKESVEKVKKYKGSIRGMNRRVEKATNEVKELEYRLKNAINKNDDVAGAKIATDLANAQDILQDATKIRDDATADYENNLRIIRESEDAIADAQKRCNQKKQKLDMAKANTALREMKAGLKVTGVTGSTFGDAEEEIDKQIDDELAKGDVDADLGTDGSKESQERAEVANLRGADLLAEYKAKFAAGGAAK